MQTRLSLDESAWTALDQAAWERAGARAAAARGLGFEALSRSLPRARRGASVVAFCPEEALAGGPAAEAAREHLAWAFGDSATRLELEISTGLLDWSSTLHVREMRESDERRRTAFVLFKSEPATCALLALPGARLLAASFRTF